MKKKASAKGLGFTILELLVVITIMGILASTVVLSSMRGMERSRDARRVQELYQTAHGLLQYYVSYEKYPDTPENDTGCDLHGVEWDVGNENLAGNDFLKPLIDEGFLTVIPKEWHLLATDCTYRYARVENPCDGHCDGYYAILYGACESPHCPTGERPSCCDASGWPEGAGDADKYDIVIFLKEKQ